MIMPFLKIKGIGKVKTSRKLPKLKKIVIIAGKKFKADKETQRVLFAAGNLAKGERLRLQKKFGLPKSLVPRKRVKA